AKKPAAKKPAAKPAAVAAPAVKTVLNPAAAWPFPTGTRP
ncbi:MAG TPA: histone, partial [Oxalicibacterium sp.]|nr:histone [Oxalicibacterium sp.]